MTGLGKWTTATIQSAQLKAPRKSSKGKSLLSVKESPSGSGESVAVHLAQMSLLSFGDKTKTSDNDPAMVSTVETLAVAGSDGSELRQEKEARSSGGIPSQ